MPRATVEDSTAGPCQALRTGRPLVGGLSFHGVSGLSTSSLAHRLPGGIQAQGMRRRSTPVWVSRSGSRTTAYDPHALGSDQQGEQRGPDLKHSETKHKSEEKGAMREEGRRGSSKSGSVQGMRETVSSPCCWLVCFRRSDVRRMVAQKKLRA